jgi:hypothetical protein
MASITESEWQALEDGLDTPAILRAVDTLDRLRAELVNPINPGVGGLSSMRDELLQLHQLAEAALMSAHRPKVAELFELAQDLELQIEEWAEALGGIRTTLSTMTALYPESLAYED